MKKFEKFIRSPVSKNVKISTFETGYDWYIIEEDYEIQNTQRRPQFYGTLRYRHHRHWPGGAFGSSDCGHPQKENSLSRQQDLSSKVQKAQEIQNYLGFPDISGAELGKAFEEHIDRMQVPIVEDRVNLIYPMGDYFSLQVGQDICEADAVILATGVNFGKPLPERRISWPWCQLLRHL